MVSSSVCFLFASSIPALELEKPETKKRQHYRPEEVKMPEHFPNLIKDVKVTIKESQSTSSKIKCPH